MIRSHNQTLIHYSTKGILAFLIGCGLALGSIAGGCGWSGYKVANDIFNNKLPSESLQLQIFKWCFNEVPFVDKLPQLLDNKIYLIILQNNMELRPSGGFMGSFAIIKTQSTGIADIAIQDIYVPDGQLVGHVDPPAPIQQAFGQGFWKLRDSNWDPDFPVAASQMAWFFDQGGQQTDGLIALNLTFVERLLSIVGPVKLVDYPETVTTTNFYSLAQRYAEEGFFPGSTQKRDFLGAVGRQLLVNIRHLQASHAIKLAQLIYHQLTHKQLLVWFKDSPLQKTVQEQGWDGKLGDYTDNYLYIVETNLGANKANCCLERAVVQEIADKQTKLTLSWQNKSPFSHPLPPAFWGGDYVNYVRVILPKEAQIQRVVTGDKDLVLGELKWQFGLQEDTYTVEDRAQHKIVGFWAKVPANQSVTAIVDYQLPPTSSIVVRRQPGIQDFAYHLIVDGKTIYNGPVTQDRILVVSSQRAWTK